MSTQHNELAVVLGGNAGETEVFAGQELQRYLEKITGAKVPMGPKAPDDVVVLAIQEAPADKAAEFCEEGYRIETTDAGLLLTGGKPRGILYSVYDFLERLGCRWYYMDPEDEVVPQLGTADVISIVRSGLKVEESPDFSVRLLEFLIYDLGPDGTPISDLVMKEMLPKLIDWLTKNRMNIIQYAIDHQPECFTHWPHFQAAYPEMRKRGLSAAFAGHCLFVFLPPAEFEKHPEWFAMVNGQRTPVGQFCTRNEEAVQFYIANLIKFLRENPDIEYAAPWPMDTGGWCECPLCRDTPSTDRLMEFGNQVAAELKKAVPNVRFSHFAYYTHLTPPKEARPDKGTMLTICLHSRDLSVPFFDPRTSEEHRESYKAWHDLCRQDGIPMILHEKYARHLGLFGIHPLPLPVMQEDCRQFLDQGLVGFELPIAYMGWRTKTFNLHVLAKLMWDVDADVNAIVDDYFARFYGDSAKLMRQAYQAVEQAQPDMRYWSNHCARKLERQPAGNSYSDEVRGYAASVVPILGQALEFARTAYDATAERAIRDKTDCFVRSIDYLREEWQVIIHLGQGAEDMATADAASDESGFRAALDAAEAQFREAKRLSDKRNETASDLSRAYLYWDVTGDGLSLLYQASQVSDWLNLVAEKRAQGFSPSR